MDDKNTNDHTDVLDSSLDTEDTDGKGKTGVDAQGKVIRATVTIVMGVVLLVGAIGIFDPTAFHAILNVTLILLTGFLVIFLILGGAVLLGAKTRVSEVFNEMLEGSLKIIDFFALVKYLLLEFVRMVQNVIIYLIPLYTILICALAYYLLLLVFRVVGHYVNPVILAFGISVIAVCALNMLNMGNTGEEKTGSFLTRFGKRFRGYMVDYAEVTILIFFFTMDIEKHPFLSSNHWGAIEASFGGVDYMAKGFSTQHGIRTGLALAGLAMFVEMVRRVFKVFMTAARDYKNIRERNPNERRFEIIKESIRSGFSSNADDLIKFLGYSTVLLGVFMFLPRLKLLSMIAFSFTNFMWDVLYPSRIFQDKGSRDLFTRLVIKIFKL